MNQYKLYRLFYQDREETLSELYDIFGDEKVILLNTLLVAINYDGINLTYKELIKKARKLNTSQFIITSNYFIDIIDRAIKDKNIISEIRFVDSVISEDMDIIKDYLDEINYGDDENKKQKVLKKLYSELNWIWKEESIDVQQIIIRYKKSDSNISNKITINNNGVISVNDKSGQFIIEKVVGRAINEKKF